MQDRSPRSIIVLAALMLAAPTAGATWYAAGSHEPDNSLDDPSLMWSDPPAAGEQKVYFNVVSGTSPGLRGILISPNAGAARTTMMSPVLETHTGILGVWIDCNGDQYVGSAESAMREYPASLLLDDSICPAVKGPTDAWTAGAHNYNGWVSELVPIGGVSTAFTPNEGELRVYRDAKAMIWGDPGLPADDASVGGTCPIAPQPRGTYQSTGGFLNYVGCLTGALNRWNDVWTGRRLAGLDVPGLDPNSPLIFQGGNGQNSWADFETFGSEDTQYSPVHVWDCNADPAFHSGDFINATFGAEAPAIHNAGDVAGINTDNFQIYEADPTTGNVGPSATLPALLNDTQEGLEDCDTSNDNGHDFYGNNYVFYVGETDFAPVSAANKTAATWNFQFQQWGRGLNPLGLDCVTFEDPPCDFAPWPELPIFGGPAGMALPAGEFSNWNPGVVATNTIGGRHLLVDTNEGSVTIAPPTYFTWYAHVGAETTSRGLLLPGGSGAYGSAQCGDNDSGIHSGWNCDPAVWYHNPDGSPQPEPTPRARIGQTYQLRDIDCYDGRNAAGVPLALSGYGARPCT